MYKRILVPVDGSKTSVNGLEKAIRLARDSGARLRVLHVVDGIAFSREHSMFTATAEKFRESGRKLIREIMTRVKKQDIQADSRMVENLTGRAADTIVKEAGKWNADVIVMGTHGRRGFNKLMLGSDAELVARTAPVPVLLVQPGLTTRRAGKKK
ncbi:MAG: universal stress protein [Pseudomonadota bacterium]